MSLDGSNTNNITKRIIVVCVAYLYSLKSQFYVVNKANDKMEKKNTLVKRFIPINLS